MVFVVLIFGKVRAEDGETRHHKHTHYFKFNLVV